MRMKTLWWLVVYAYICALLILVIWSSNAGYVKTVGVVR